MAYRRMNVCAYKQKKVAKPRCPYRMKYFECQYPGHCELQNIEG